MSKQADGTHWLWDCATDFMLEYEHGIHEVKMNLGRCRVGMEEERETTMDKKVFADGKSVRMWYHSFVMKDEQEAQRVAAAINEAVAIWQNGGDSLHKEVLRQCPDENFGELCGMMQNWDKVRCALDTEDTEDEVAMNPTLFNAIDVVQTAGYRERHGIEQGTGQRAPLQFHMYASVPIEGIVPAGAPSSGSAPGAGGTLHSGSAPRGGGTLMNSGGAPKTGSAAESGSAPKVDKSPPKDESLPNSGRKLKRQKR